MVVWLLFKRRTVLRLYSLLVWYIKSVLCSTETHGNYAGPLKYQPPRPFLQLLGSIVSWPV